LSLHEHTFIDTGDSYVCSECGEVSTQPYFANDGQYFDAIKNRNVYSNNTQFDYGRHSRDQTAPFNSKCIQIPGMNTCCWTVKDIRFNSLTKKHDPYFYRRIWQYYSSTISSPRKYYNFKRSLFPILNYFELDLPKDQFIYLCELALEYNQRFPGKTYVDICLMSLYVVLSEYQKGMPLQKIMQSPFPSAKNTCFHILTNLGQMGHKVDNLQIIFCQLSNWLSKLALPPQWIYPLGDTLRKIKKSHLAFGKSLVGITAGIIYVYTHALRALDKTIPSLTQTSIAETCGITEATLRANAKIFGKFVIIPKAKVKPTLLMEVL
jgi:hypothetical protein